METRIKAWANMQLNGSPEDLAAAAGARAALLNKARELKAKAGAGGPSCDLDWGESGPDKRGYMDAWVYGDAGEMAPLLKGLGEQGFDYAVDVDVTSVGPDGEPVEEPDEGELEAEVERVVALCGDGVAYAERYDVP